MKNRVKTILFFAIMIVVIIVIIMVNKNKKINTTDTKIVDNKATNDVVVEKIQFKNITKVYEGGITTIRANIYNNTKDTKTFKVKLVLRDNTGKEITNATQIIENLGPGKTKVFTTGIAGDYSLVEDIKFETID